MSFWEYAVALYTRPGVSNAVLTLQDNAGANVNVLLFACWLATEPRMAPSAQDFATGLGRIDKWGDAVTKPLRKLRREAKAVAVVTEGGERARTAIKTAELAAERVEIGLLAAIPRTLPMDDGRASALAFLTDYLGAEAANRHSLTIDHLLTAAFSDD